MYGACAIDMAHGEAVYRVMAYIVMAYVSFLAHGEAVALGGREAVVVFERLEHVVGQPFVPLLQPLTYSP